MSGSYRAAASLSLSAAPRSGSRRHSDRRENSLSLWAPEKPRDSSCPSCASTVPTSSQPLLLLLLLLPVRQPPVQPQVVLRPPLVVGQQSSAGVQPQADHRLSYVLP